MCPLLCISKDLRWLEGHTQRYLPEDDAALLPFPAPAPVMKLQPARKQGPQDCGGVLGAGLWEAAKTLQKGKMQGTREGSFGGIGGGGGSDSTDVTEQTEPREARGDLAPMPCTWCLNSSLHRNHLTAFQLQNLHFQQFPGDAAAAGRSHIWVPTQEDESQ